MYLYAHTHARTGRNLIIVDALTSGRECVFERGSHCAHSFYRMVAFWRHLLTNLHNMKERKYYKPVLYCKQTRPALCARPGRVRRTYLAALHNHHSLPRQPPSALTILGRARYLCCCVPLDPTALYQRILTVTQSLCSPILQYP